ncbi:MAG: MG2 domain-containing protein [Candidatus Lokiarchaeia archaeon]
MAGKARESLEVLLNIDKEDKRGKNILNQITTIDVDKIQNLIKQIAELAEPPLIFIRMNSEFDEGETISGRIICMDKKFQPLQCQVTFTTDSSTSFKGQTDDFGSLEFVLPSDQKSYEVKANASGKEKTCILDLTGKKTEYVCYVLTDRDWYMPGQKILLRFLLWKMVGSSFQPSGENIKVSLIDPENNKVLLREISCDSKFGVGELQIPIAEEALEGEYRLQVSVNGYDSEKVLTIMRYKPPDIELEVECEPEYLKIGEDFKVKLQSTYFYGSPMKGGQVTLEILSSDKKSVLQTYGETDDKGEYEYRFKIPSIKEGESTVKVTVKDELKREASKNLELSAVKKALRVAVEMAESIEPGQQAELTVKTEVTALEGKTKPLPDCTVLASINDTELRHYAKFKMGKTDAEGRLPLTFEIDYPTEKRKNFDINLEIESEKLGEHQSIRRGLTVQKAEPKEEAEKEEVAKVWLSASVDSSSYNMGDVIRLKLNAEKRDLPIYLDVEKENVIYRAAALMEKGEAELEIPVTSNMWGRVKLVTYAFRPNGVLEKNERTVYINPEGKELQIHLESDKSNYRPGETATFKVRVLQQGELAACCLGAMLVDAAILQLGRKIETPLEVLFKKNFTEKKIMELKTWDSSEYTPYFEALIEALIHYSYLNPSVLGAVIELFRIINNAGLLPLYGLSSAQEEVIKLIQENAEKSTEKNRKTLTYNILQYLSESTIPVESTEIIMQAAEPEISKISDKELELYQSIISDIQKAQKEGLITETRKEQLLIKVHEAALKVAYTKSAPITLELRKQLDKMLENGVKDKKALEDLVEKVDLKFQPLRKLSPEELKDPEGNPIVLELGTYLSKIGFAGEDAPRSVLPTLIGYPKYTSIMTDIDHYHREYYIGEEVMDLGGAGASPPTGPAALHLYFDRSSAPGAASDYKRSIGADSKPLAFLSKAGKSLPKRYYRGGGVAYMIGSGGMMDVPSPMVSVRFRFPETSLWIPYLESEGESQIETVLPDQITSHELTVFASTNDCEAGMGTHRVTVKQEFFTQLDIPPVLTHGDRIQLGVILTNITDEDLSCEVNLNSEGNLLRIEVPQNEILVPAEGMVRLDFTLHAENPGEDLLIVESVTPKYVDIVRKEVKINPKGEPHIFRQTGIITEDQVLTMSPTIPQEAIYYRAYLTLVPGYQMGCVDGLESIIDYPHGCTEQTMSRFLPNIAVFQLFEERGRLTRQFQEKVHQMVTVGVQQLISLKHSDGGWGWWKDDMSDPFLTAHVLFGLAYTINAGFFADQKLLIDAINSLEKTQSPHGFWQSGSRSQEFTTAYVAQAMLEAKKAGIPVKQEILTNALNFLVSKATPSSDIINDPTIMARILIAMIEGGFNPDRREAQFLVERLTRLAQSEEGQIYWNKGSALAGNVESTAYVTMALHRAGADPVTVQSALNYIIANRASGGGWSTTSDTLASILCLQKCARGEKANYTVKATLNNNPLGEYTVKDDTSESVVYDMRNIPLKNLGVDNRLTLEKKGEGLLVYDLIVKAWYPKEYLLKPETLTVTRSFSSQKVDHNGSVKVKINIRTTQKQGMLIIEETIPAGFIVFESSLENLLSKNRIAAYKLTSEKLFLYLQELEGSVNLTYQMIATKAGEVIAKETVIYPMYNVEQRANSKIIKLEVQ